MVINCEFFWLYNANVVEGFVECSVSERVSVFTNQKQFAAVWTGWWGYRIN